MTPSGYAARSLCLTLTLVPSPHGLLSTTIRQPLVELRPVARPQELSCCLKTYISLSNSAIGSLHPSPYTRGYIFKSSVFRHLMHLCILCVYVCLSVSLSENHHPPQCQQVIPFQSFQIPVFLFHGSQTGTPTPTPSWCLCPLTAQS